MKLPAKYVVELTFTADGTTKFAAATRTAWLGQSIGIYYDGKFVSVPTVNAAITDGKAVIEGMSTIEGQRTSLPYIRIGGLSLTLNELRSNVVGAQLGQEAIKTSLIGGAIGLAIVMLIMIFVYMLPGVIASFALHLRFVDARPFKCFRFDADAARHCRYYPVDRHGRSTYLRAYTGRNHGGTSVRGAINAGFPQSHVAIDGHISGAAVLARLEQARSGVSL